MNNCIEQRLARNFSYQKNSGYTRRYLRLKRRRNWSQKSILYLNFKNRPNAKIGNIETKNNDFISGINNLVIPLKTLFLTQLMHLLFYL
jgi:hypothetical protein